MESEFSTFFWQQMPLPRRENPFAEVIPANFTRALDAWRGMWICVRSRDAQ